MTQRYFKPARLLPALLLYGALMPRHAAQADAATEAQLRAALQQATTQIAQLEDQLANLQAEQAPNAAMINTLQAQLKALKQQGAAPATTAPAGAPADEAKQLAALQRRLAAETAALGKTQAGYQQAASTANANATANQQLTAQLTTLKAQQKSCELNNAALYKTANEILTQLAHRDTLWGNFSSAEPFIGTERVKLQNIVQNDQDKIDNNVIQPGGAGQ